MGDQMKTKAIITAIAMLSLLFITSCGGTEETADQTAEQEAASETDETSDLTVAAADEPAELSEQVYMLYEDGLIRATAVVQEVDAPEEQLSQLESLREELITKLVVLGKKITELDEEEKTKFQNDLRMKVGGVDAELYKSYQETLQQVWDNEELRRLFRSFNIITQYSQFELLKKQEPEEAVRLGIE
jgi:uncharacterized Ntn-hydrolase superfamily protein